MTRRTQVPIFGIAALLACTLEIPANLTATAANTASTSDASDESSATDESSTGEGTGPEAPACTQACPERCADVRVSLPSTEDGAYTLYAGGDPSRSWSAWCADMGDDSPSEYLILPMVGPGINYSHYVPAINQPRVAVITSFTRVRIDPVSFLVDINDRQFSHTVGNNAEGGQAITSMPYATARDCSGAKLARANIDLRQTPFSVPLAQFLISGHIATGLALTSYQNQVIDLRVGGECGTIGPNFADDPQFPFGHQDRFYLELEYSLGPQG